MSPTVTLRRVFRREEVQEKRDIMLKLEKMQNDLVSKGLHVDIFKSIWKGGMPIIVTFYEPMLTAEECVYLKNDLGFEEV